MRLVALRCAGFNQVDLAAAEAADIAVARVPAYSPHAVAEHVVAMILTLNRKTHRAWNRVREGNFSLDGLLGFDLHGKTVGIVGTGRIGEVLARILAGFGCSLLAHDPVENPACKALAVRYVGLDELLGEVHKGTSRNRCLTTGRALGLDLCRTTASRPGRGSRTRRVDSRAATSTASRWRDVALTPSTRT